MGSSETPFKEIFFRDAFNLLNRRLLTPEGWFLAGEPYFRGWFGRDAFITALQTLAIDPRNAKNTLVFAAKQQNEFGNIPHEIRDAWYLRLIWGKPPYYNAVDAAARFVITLSEYFDRTGDEQLLTTLWPHAKRAISRYLEDPTFTRYGFIAYRKKNPFDLTHQNWRDGGWNYFGLRKPIFPLDVQCLLYEALRRMRLLARDCMAEKDYGEKLREIARGVRKRVHRHFRWQKAEYFFTYLHGEDLSPLRVIMPEPATVVSTGIFSNDDAAAIFRRVTKKDLWTSFGIRSVSAYNSRWFIDLPTCRRWFTFGSIWIQQLWEIWRSARQFGYTALGVELEGMLHNLLLAVLWKVKPLGEMREVCPEVVAVSEDDPPEIEVPRGANMRQAWSAGAVLDMFYWHVNQELRSLKFGE
ncbi:MAG: hypothetical protein HYS57_02250 [Parcubacteria group bacterium]|nr:hypothetical protein [Parcubacteria group bacterium]